MLTIPFNSVAAYRNSQSHIPHLYDVPVALAPLLETDNRVPFSCKPDNFSAARRDADAELSSQLHWDFSEPPILCCSSNLRQRTTVVQNLVPTAQLPSPANMKHFERCSADILQTCHQRLNWALQLKQACEQRFCTILYYLQLLQCQTCGGPSITTVDQNYTGRLIVPSASESSIRTANVAKCPTCSSLYGVDPPLASDMQEPPPNRSPCNANPQEIHQVFSKKHTANGKESFNPRISPPVGVIAISAKEASLLCDAWSHSQREACSQFIPTEDRNSASNLAQVSAAATAPLCNLTSATAHTRAASASRVAAKEATANVHIVPYFISTYPADTEDNIQLLRFSHLRTQTVHHQPYPHQPTSSSLRLSDQPPIRCRWSVACAAPAHLLGLPSSTVAPYPGPTMLAVEDAIQYAFLHHPDTIFSKFRLPWLNTPTVGTSIIATVMPNPTLGAALLLVHLGSQVLYSCLPFGSPLVTSYNSVRPSKGLTHASAAVDAHRFGLECEGLFEQSLMTTLVAYTGLITTDHCRSSANEVLLQPLVMVAGADGTADQSGATGTNVAAAATGIAAASDFASIPVKTHPVQTSTLKTYISLDCLRQQQRSQLCVNKALALKRTVEEELLMLLNCMQQRCFLCGGFSSEVSSASLF